MWRASDRVSVAGRLVALFGTRSAMCPAPRGSTRAGIPSADVAEMIHQIGELGRQPFPSAGAGIAADLHGPSRRDQSQRPLDGIGGAFQQVGFCITVLRCDHGEKLVEIVIHRERQPLRRID